MKRFRFHYCVLWLVIFAAGQWTVGTPGSPLVTYLGIAMLVLSFPAGFGAALALGLLSLTSPAKFPPQFWASRAGLIVGWVAFFAAGYFQWFLFIPWLTSKFRRKRVAEESVD